MTLLAALCACLVAGILVGFGLGKLDDMRARRADRKSEAGSRDHTPATDDRFEDMKDFIRNADPLGGPDQGSPVSEHGAHHAARRSVSRKTSRSAPRPASGTSGSGHADGGLVGAYGGFGGGCDGGGGGGC